ncbi:DUF4440 domain-containing protein [Nannocystis sp. ILAH1]|uniref:DUF4440 domain-containing protein n=1 Tax=Nannocystis sp. ILAH1 TaxID=2996789 RepID=UPI00226E0104|nr:DUF4440 domain-containing protein [Nannocystis sp. ILAH1]
MPSRAKARRRRPEGRAGRGDVEDARVAAPAADAIRQSQDMLRVDGLARVVEDAGGSAVEYRIQEFNVRPLAGGAVALVTGRYHGRIGLGGAVLSDKQVRFTSVWERRDAGWILLRHHLTSCAG